MSFFILLFVKAVSILINVLNFLILVSVLLSWLPISPESRFVYFINYLTEPILAPCRKLLMRFEFARNLPFDFSPILAWLLLMVIGDLVQLLYYLV